MSQIEIPVVLDDQGSTIGKMDEPEFCLEHITADRGTWEYDGDTGIIVYPNLFSDELRVPSPDHQERTDVSLASSDDGAFTTITNLGEAIAKAKSTFEVVEIDTSSCCVSDYARSACDGITDNSEAAGDDALFNWALSSGDESPRTKSSFPEGSIILDHNHTGHSEVNGGYGLSPDKQGIIIQDDNQDPCACDRSSAVSSLTYNDSVFPLRLFIPRDSIGMIFDPFLEAKRSLPSSAPHGNKRSSGGVTGLNRFITSTRNVASIFRPQPKFVRTDLHLHRAQSSSVLPASCPPAQLVITTTYSHLTPSVCSNSSGDKNKTLARAPSLCESNDSHLHSISQLFTNEVRERYPTAVLRSYQRHYYPSFSLCKASLDEGVQRKRRRLFFLLLFLASLVAGVISIAVIATGRDANRLHELSTIDKLQDGSVLGDGSLPNACCLEGIHHLDKMTGDTENDEEDAEGTTGVGNALPGDHNSSSGDDGGMGPIVSLASSQNSDPLSSHLSPVMAGK